MVVSFRSQVDSELHVDCGPILFNWKIFVRIRSELIDDCAGNIHPILAWCRLALIGSCFSSASALNRQFKQIRIDYTVRLTGNRCGYSTVARSIGLLDPNSNITKSALPAINPLLVFLDSRLGTRVDGHHSTAPAQSPRLGFLLLIRFPSGDQIK